MQSDRLIKIASVQSSTSGWGVKSAIGLSVAM